jgi:hypothetical protein
MRVSEQVPINAALQLKSWALKMRRTAHTSTKKHEFPAARVRIIYENGSMVTGGRNEEAPERLVQCNLSYKVQCCSRYELAT